MQLSAAERPGESSQERAQRRHREEWLERSKKILARGHDSDGTTLLAMQIHEEAAERARFREEAKQASGAELQALINSRIMSKRLNSNS